MRTQWLCCKKAKSSFFNDENLTPWKTTGTDIGKLVIFLAYDQNFYL